MTHFTTSKRYQESWSSRCGQWPRHGCNTWSPHNSLCKPMRANSCQGDRSRWGANYSHHHLVQVHHSWAQWVDQRQKRLCWQRYWRTNANLALLKQRVHIILQDIHEQQQQNRHWTVQGSTHVAQLIIRYLPYTACDDSKGLKNFVCDEIDV